MFPSQTSADATSEHPAGRTDRRLLEAADVARDAAEQEAGAELRGPVGPYVGVEVEDTHAATHLFEATQPGYHGWRWAVTLATAGPEHPVTISEVVLLPGPDALVAPAWVPWNERVRAGDLGVGDLLPTPDDDDRLVPGYLLSDDPAIEDVTRELGLGRPRVLGREGRIDLAQRWFEGDTGPETRMARGAPGTCAGCGFYLPLAGSLSAAFGVCGNEFAPADGQVVHAEYGCGAHSETEVDAGTPVAVAELVYDDAELDLVRPAESSGAADAAPDGSADA